MPAAEPLAGVTSNLRVCRSCWLAAMAVLAGRGGGEEAPCCSSPGLSEPKSPRGDDPPNYPPEAVKENST